MLLLCLSVYLTLLPMVVIAQLHQQARHPFCFSDLLHNQNALTNFKQKQHIFLQFYWIFFFVFFADSLPCSHPTIDTEKILTLITQLFGRRCSLSPSLAQQALRGSCEKICLHAVSTSEAFNRSKEGSLAKQRNKKKFA